MSWFSERLELTKTIVGHRKYVLGAIFAAIITFFDQIQAGVRWALLRWLQIYSPPRGDDMIFGFPSWILGITAFLGLLFWWTLEYALRQHRQLTPRVSLTFDSDKGCVRISPIKHLNQDGTLRDENEVLTICGLVTTESKKTVERCTAYVTNVKKKNPNTGIFNNTEYIDDLSLPWAITNQTEIDIPHGIRRYFGILSAEKGGTKLQWASGIVWSLRHRTLFNDHTTYEIDLAVAGDGITKTLTIYVKWNGVLACPH